MPNRVKAIPAKRYDVPALIASLPDDLFSVVNPGDTVILKPNWVMQSHKYRPDDWEYVITHPSVITAVVEKVLPFLDGRGRVVIIDGPTTEASFEQLIARYPVAEWRRSAQRAGVTLDVIDLREHEWETENDIIVRRSELPGDPRGKVEVDLVDTQSEFFGHRKSSRGYHGADYDRDETNRAHDGKHNRYSVSRTVIEGDVFINLPKLKTHRKAGITCCLKNLVGINTYKNFLPHYSEGGPAEGGDQFPGDNVSARVEGALMGYLKLHVLRNPRLARILSPLNTVGRKVFGDTREVVRSGNWFGNDTLWRMVLDLNKILLFATPEGAMRPFSNARAKRYIGIVDAILAGEGHGPLAPEPVEMGYLICGVNPVAIDAVSAVLMGFSPSKIPCIARAFDVREYRLCEFGLDDIIAEISGIEYTLAQIPEHLVTRCEPQFGWKGRIEAPVAARVDAEPIASE